MASCSNKRRRLTEKEQHMITNFIDNIGEADEYESIETGFGGDEEDKDIREMVEDDAENNGREGERLAEDVEDDEEDVSDELPRKQRFKNLAQVLDESMCDPLPPQPRKSFK